jgi:hypothetical protein
MASEIDWEFGLGLPKEALEDDIKGMDELSLSNKLLKVCFVRKCDDHLD